MKQLIQSVLLEITLLEKWDFLLQKKLQIEVPLTAVAYTTGEGRIDRASVSANYLIGHGFGLSSTVAYADTKDTDPSSPLFGGALPYVPDWMGQIALTWVNEANVKATLAAN